MNDSDIKEILETIYGDEVPDGVLSLIHEMRRRAAMFGPYETTRKDVIACTIMFDLYIKAKNSVKRGRTAKDETAKEEANG